VPPGDLLIHAGDFTFYSKRPRRYRNFDLWLGELPHRYKIIIPAGIMPVRLSPRQNHIRAENWTTPFRDNPKR